jgi:hypothetical protein
MKTIQLTIILGLILALTACDAIRVVKITNKSMNPIVLKTDFPETSVYLTDSSGNFIRKTEYIKDINEIRKGLENFQIDTTSDGLIITLHPMQSFNIAGHIGPGLIKIQPWDLYYSKLTIYSASDTIVAESKEEIIQLFDNKKTKYRKRLDKKDIGYSNKFYRHIVVRK